MQKVQPNKILLISIVISLLILSAFFAGCTGNTQQAPATPVVTTTPATPTPTAQPTPQAATTTTAPVAVATTSTPAPVYTYSEGNVVAYTAASLKGVTPKLAADFAKMYPGHKVVFNLDGTQALKTQVQNGAYSDVFISASNAYTTELTKGGYFVDGSVKPLTSNYVILILPAKNPAKITSIADLAKPGIKIARADKSVPVGTATNAVLANEAKLLGQDWNKSVNANTVTYETSEPSVAAKVALGEVDAGFVYESTASASPDKYVAISIPKSENYLQTYQIAVLKGSTSKGAAENFETFMLSSVGQQDLKDYGFQAISTT